MINIEVPILLLIKNINFAFLYHSIVNCKFKYGNIYRNNSEPHNHRIHDDYHRFNSFNNFWNSSYLWC